MWVQHPGIHSAISEENPVFVPILNMYLQNLLKMRINDKFRVIVQPRKQIHQLMNSLFCCIISYSVVVFQRLWHFDAKESTKQGPGVPHSPLKVPKILTHSVVRIHFKVQLGGNNHKLLKQEPWSSASKFHSFYPLTMRKNLLLGVLIMPIHSLCLQTQILDIICSSFQRIPLTCFCL